MTGFVQEDADRAEIAALKLERDELQACLDQYAIDRGEYVQHTKKRITALERENRQLRETLGVALVGLTRLAEGGGDGLWARTEAENTLERLARLRLKHYREGVGA